MKKSLLFLIVAVTALFFGGNTNELNAESEPQEIKVGVVLPATTQLKITNVNESVAAMGGVFTIKSDNDTFTLVDYNIDFNMNNKFSINGVSVTYSWDSNPYIIIDTSDWDINKRTISTVTTDDGSEFMWENLNPESEPSGHTKVFETNDVLPATTQLRISWLGTSSKGMPNWPNLGSGGLQLHFITNTGDPYDGQSTWYIGGVYVTKTNGGNFWDTIENNYVDIDTSTWTLEQRTITYYETMDEDIYWEDLEPESEPEPEPSEYTIYFETNGGTSVSNIEEVTELPTPLPTPTKLNNIFAGWYYNSALNQRAYAGDEIEDDVTLYAKWSTGGGVVSPGENSTSITDEVLALVCILAVGLYLWKKKK